MSNFGARGLQWAKRLKVGLQNVRIKYAINSLLQKYLKLVGIVVCVYAQSIGGQFRDVAPLFLNLGTRWRDGSEQ